MRGAILSCNGDWCVLRWRVDGAARVVVPPLAGRARQDGLWQATCFELFVAGPGETYAEFNFSPSERWAAYDFTGYRTGMADRVMPRPPVITPRRGGDVLFCDVAIPIECLPPRPFRFGLTAVIVEEGDVRSFWAMAHGGERPDFHDRACFAATLAAPDAA